MQHSKKQKPNYFKDLLLLFAVPTSIAVFAALVIYIPQLIAHPKYDFIYSACETYACDTSFTVDSVGHVTESDTINEKPYGITQLR